MAAQLGSRSAPASNHKELQEARLGESRNNALILRWHCLHAAATLSPRTAAQPGDGKAVEHSLQVGTKELDRNGSPGQRRKSWEIEGLAFAPRKHIDDRATLKIEIPCACRVYV